jgi:hypothetical protein
MKPLHTLLAVALLALPLGGCLTTEQPQAVAPLPDSQQPPKISDAELFGRAKKAVTAKLKDPRSADFGPMYRKTTYHRDTGLRVDSVCGLVNAKNSFGGYTGMKPFYFTLDSNLVMVASDFTSIANISMDTALVLDISGPDGTKQT